LALIFCKNTERIHLQNEIEDMIAAVSEEIKVHGEGYVLPGELEIPQGSSSLVLFSHGSGSSRLSTRNQFVAGNLRENGIGTFLFDLLGAREDNVQARFNISLLTERLLFVTDWILKQRYTKDFTIGYFGASTGAASALNAAAKMGPRIKAVVSRGGRPDLAMPMLPRVKAATLLLIGGLDTDVLELNRKAFERLNNPKELKVIPGASHLFEEPGKLEEVAIQASNWFSKYLI
jgi:putative phosphoribosyl transferase